MKKVSLLHATTLSWLMLITCSLSCTPASGPTETTQPDLAVVIGLSQPVTWLARQIAPPDVEVRCAMPPTAHASTWRPAPETIAALYDADLILAHGLDYEAWTATATLPMERFVETAPKAAAIATPVHTHHHGEQGEHSHGGIDPHTFRDPVLFQQQADAVLAALRGAFPHQAEAMTSRTGMVRERLGAIHLETQTALAAWKEQAVASNQPAWRYVARRYALTPEPFDLDPKRGGSPDELTRLGHWVDAQTDTPFMWWENPPTSEVAATLPARLVHVHIDPLDQPHPDERYDYIEQARANVERLSRAIQDAGAP